MGKTATVCVTIDNLGRAREVGLGQAVRPDPDEPGLRYGVPRLLGLFDELAIRATFFVEGWNGLHHRDVLAAIAAEDHEIGLHGWVHENWAALDDGQQERLLHDGTAALRAAGVEPAGFRAPGGYRGRRTAAVLKELGYSFDSSIDPETENDPLAVTVLPEGIVTIPWHWDMIDYWHYEMQPGGAHTPAQVAAHWNALLDDAVASGGLVTLIVHPFVSGADDTKFAALQQVLRRAAGDPGIEVLSAGRVANRYIAAGVA